ncbi:MAG: DUF1761 family protein, partial [bacterium]
WATAAAWVLFVVWFSPFVFGGAWARLENLSDEGVRSSLLPRLGLALLISVAQALCLAGFFNFTGSDGFLMGALAGLQLCVGLVLPAGLLILLMGRRHPALIGIYLGWLLLAQALAGGILAAWH